VNNRTFAWFLARSLELLEAECPAAYAAICRKLGERRVAIRVDGERVGVGSSSGRLSIDQSTAPAVAEAVASRTALLRLLDGKSTLTQSILTDEIILSGAIDDLVPFYEGLIAYFHGAVRSPGFPRLLYAFIGSSDPLPHHSLSAPVE